MSHRGHRAHANVSNNQATYRGIPITTTLVRTVHCKAVNRQVAPEDALAQHHDPESAACFACGGTQGPVYRCKPK